MIPLTWTNTVDEVLIDKAIKILDYYRGYDEMNEVLDCIPRENTNTHVQDVDIQVTENCNLCCTYCFQHNKSKARLSFEDAKKFIDILLLADENDCDYVNTKKNHGIIIGFVGGDALLEIDLIDKVVTYFVNRMIELNHPWLDKWIVHLDTNGVLYFDERVQRFLRKWPNTSTVEISLDGSKEMHDMCRIFPDGSGSYDYAYRAVTSIMNHGVEPGSKITVAPDNVHLLVDAIKNFIDIGFTKILCNCVFEDVWTDEICSQYYNQLIKLADYLVDNGLSNKIVFSPFSDNLYVPEDPTYLCNRCGGDGQMVSLGADGYICNCYRYNRSALGDSQEPLYIGHVDRGIGITAKDKANIASMRACNRRSLSDDECFFCPIAKGCNYCNGYSYELYGTPCKRTKFHCHTHVAEALASNYYFNRRAIYNNVDERNKLYVPKDMAMAIISESEYNKILKLSERR